MEDNEQKPNNQNNPKRVIRKPEDLDLKNRLLSSPELFITEKGSDEYLDRLSLKLKLFGLDGFDIDEFVSNAGIKYETKFHKYWFYKLADLFGVDRSVMDVWVKPEFVRLFIIQAVYARFPRKMLNALRRNKIVYGNSGNKLYHYLTNEASEKLDLVIEQVYQVMKRSENPLDFWKNYSKEYEVYFQTELF